MKKTEITRLIQVMKKLRDPINGCPWDKKQTMDTYLLNHPLYLRVLKMLRFFFPSYFQLVNYSIMQLNH